MRWFLPLSLLLRSSFALAAEPAKWPAAPPERPGPALLVGAGAALVVGAVAVAAAGASDHRRTVFLNSSTGEGEFCDLEDCRNDQVLSQLSDHLYTAPGSPAGPGRANKALVGAGVAGGLGVIGVSVGLFTLRF